MFNLIWQTQNGDETEFEYEYLTEALLKNTTCEKYFDNKSYKTVLNNSIIIYSNNRECVDSDFENYLEEFSKRGYVFYLVHLSNENLSHNSSYYSKATKVFRSYYDPSISLSNVYYIPLGFKSGYLNLNFDSKQECGKRHDFCFIGQLKSDRYEMLESIKQYSSNSFIHLTQSWNCRNSLSTEECKKVYNQSRFTPCPMGWVHGDSFRIMESLENWSIPILKSYNGFNYHTKIWGENPLPKINSWQDLQDFSNLSEHEYEIFFNKVFDWYQDYRKNILTNLIF
jgi:hypothetical protein